MFGASTVLTGVRPKARSERGLYVPPSDISGTTLGELLVGTNRAFAAQPDLLGDTKSAVREERIPIYYAGNISLVGWPCVSVIGTRNVSDMGAARARKIAKSLVDSGVAVVSGLAEGVDTEAMTAAIASGGRTIGVIGTPLDKAYPASNAGLQQEIYTHHLLLSQFEIGRPTQKANFPLRNRVMATISQATIVIEASDTSGTLHQAVECTRLGRWLFISQSVAEDPTLTWPRKFLKYDTCVVLRDMTDVFSRIGVIKHT